MRAAALITALAVSTGTAAAEADVDAKAKAEVDTGRAVAERLAGEAKLRFDAHDYTAAIEGYGEAYRQHPSPGLLFNLAQAYRLRGNCAAATLTYHQYLRAVPGSPYRDVVETHLEQLEPCAYDQALASSRKLPSPGRGRRIAGAVMGVAGVALMLGGASRDQRHDQLGAGLIGAGAVTAATGVTLYVLGHRADRAAALGFTASW